MNTLVEENTQLQGKLASMRDYVGSAEVETRACRETITRLVSEAEKEQKATTQYSMELDSIRLVSCL